MAFYEARGACQISAKINYRISHIRGPVTDQQDRSILTDWQDSEVLNGFFKITHCKSQALLQNQSTVTLTEAHIFSKWKQRLQMMRIGAQTEKLKT